MLGIALRAAADNFTMTRMLGVPANTVISTAFAISGIMAGIVSIFWIGRSASVTPTIGAPPLLVAFVATVIGGMRSLTGAVVGGFVYAILISLLGIFLPPGLLEFREAFMFAIVIIILLFRPEGLIRSKNLRGACWMNLPDPLQTAQHSADPGGGGAAHRPAHRSCWVSRC